MSTAPKSNRTTPDPLEDARARRDAARVVYDASPDLLAACRAVIGHGYCEISGNSSQDYVSKKAILAVRRALAKAENR